MKKLIILLLIICLQVGNVWADYVFKEYVDFNDNFNSTVLDGKWTFVDNDGNTGGSYTLTGSTLKLNSNGGGAWNYVDNYVALYLDGLVTGDFDFSVKVVEINSSNSDWAKAGICIKTDMSKKMDNTASIYFCYMDTSGNNLCLQYDSDLDGDIDTSVDKSNFTRPLWIRIKRIGDTFYFYAKDNETDSWTADGSYTKTGCGEVDVGLWFSNNSSGNDGYAEFDDFKDLR